MHPQFVSAFLGGLTRLVITFSASHWRDGTSRRLVSKQPPPTDHPARRLPYSFCAKTYKSSYLVARAPVLQIFNK